MTTDTKLLRNIAIVGHTATGKTTLVEQILFEGKVIPKAEKVETGRTVSDYTDEEIKRAISIHTTLSHLTWRDVKINLLDTPGSADFAGEVMAAFRSCESALVVIGARSGVQIETLKLWRYLDEHKMPRMAFINKVDKAAGDYWQTLEDMKEKLQATFIPVTIPMGHDQDHKGVINLLDMKAYPFSEAGEIEKPMEIPAEYRKEAEKARVALIEEAAEGDEALLDKYAAQDTLSDEDIKLGLREGLERNMFVPVFCGSATLNSGIVPFLDFVAFDSPSPYKVEEPCVTGEQSRIISHDGKFSGLIFKTTIDQFAGRLSWVKVVTGKLSHSSEAFNPRLGKVLKLGKIYTAQGKKLVEVEDLDAGDIGIISKIEELRTNDTLCSADQVIHYLPLQLPKPVHSITIASKVQKDEDKLTQLLVRYSEEDLTFQMHYSPETKETIVSAMGELQLGIVLDRIRENKVDFLTRPPRVSYRETITKDAEAEYTHKKQTGGHGQYGKVLMDFHPLPRGTGFKFSNTLKGQNVSKGYLPAVEKGIMETLKEGLLAGFPMIDIHANLSDGKEHAVDSSELSFKLAAKGALRTAMETARPILLEPVMNLNIFIEEKYLGDVLADLSGRKGRVLGQETIGKDILVIKAQAPHAELLQYALQLKSLTSGTGAFEMDFDHYSPLGTKESEALIKEYQAHRKAGSDE